MSNKTANEGEAGLGRRPKELQPSEKRKLNSRQLADLAEAELTDQVNDLNADPNDEVDADAITVVRHQLERDEPMK